MNTRIYAAARKVGDDWAPIDGWTTTNRHDAQLRVDMLNRAAERVEDARRYAVVSRDVSPWLPVDGEAER